MLLGPSCQEKPPGFSQEINRGVMCNSWAVDRCSSDPLSPFPSVHLSLSLVGAKFLHFHVFEICERTLLTVADAKCTFCKSVSIGSIAVGTLARSWHIWRTHEDVCPHQHTVFFSKFVKLGFPLSFFFSTVPPLSLPSPRANFDVACLCFPFGPTTGNICMSVL